jgi:predicted MFS family arabinose efflux permease
MTARRTLLPLIFAITLTGILGNTLIAPAIPDILDDFGVGDGGAGVLIAATSLPGVVLAPVIGLMADRFGRRQVVVPCLLIFGSFGLAAAAAPSFPMLVGARLGMGVGSAGLINLAIVLIGDHWEGSDRTRLIGRNAVVLTIGLAIVPPVGGALAQWASWRIALLPYGLALITAAAAWRMLDATRPPPGPSVREQLGGLGQAVRQPQLIIVYVGAMVSFVLIFGVFLATLPIHLEDEFGYGAGMRGLFLAVPALPSMVVAFNIERLRRHAAPRLLLAGSATLLAVAFTLMGSTTLAVLVVLGCIFHGLGEGALIPTMQDMAVTLAPHSQRGAVVALFVSCARLGQTIGPLGAALVFDATSTSAALRLGAVLAIGLAALFLIGLTFTRPDRAIPTGAAASTR